MQRSRAGHGQRSYVSRIIAPTGGTCIGAYDALRLILEAARAEYLYTHHDVASAGVAMIFGELRRDIWDGIEGYGSIVFNTHKWLGA